MPSSPKGANRAALRKQLGMMEVCRPRWFGGVAVNRDNANRWSVEGRKMDQDAAADEIVRRGGAVEPRSAR